eukprot:84733-Prymnesium_polylepis.2
MHPRSSQPVPTHSEYAARRIAWQGSRVAGEQEADTNGWEAASETQERRDQHLRRHADSYGGHVECAPPCVPSWVAPVDDRRPQHEEWTEAKREGE